MKRLIICTSLIISIFRCHAQVNHYEACSGAIKTGIAYVKDFPGMKGGAVYVEYIAPINTWLQASVGVKRIQNIGYPRTTTIEEFTRATTLDATLFLIPVNTEKSALKIGLGYSSALYSIRRAYPTYTKTATTTIINWETISSKGRSNGLTLAAEYEYFTDGPLSLGARMQYANAYQYVLMTGAFAAFRF
jgi:hypothetical protein